jgi:AcrR family transcriptional regulator
MASRRDAILAAALELFAQRGLAGTSIDDIRAACGASVGSIYHHFGSKEGIAVALYAGAIDDYQRGALAALRRARTTAAGVRAMATQFLDWVADHRELAVLMLDSEHRDVRTLAADAVAALNADYFAERRRWVEERTKSGELVDLPSDVFVHVVLGPAWRWAEAWLAGRTKTPMAQAKRIFADAAWRAVSAPA